LQAAKKSVIRHTESLNLPVWIRITDEVTCARSQCRLEAATITSRAAGPLSPSLVSIFLSAPVVDGHHDVRSRLMGSLGMIWQMRCPLEAAGRSLICLGTEQIEAQDRKLSLEAANVLTGADPTPQSTGGSIGG
jgi:hypothetical protein